LKHSTILRSTLRASEMAIVVLNKRIMWSKICRLAREQAKNKNANSSVLTVPVGQHQLNLL